MQPASKNLHSLRVEILAAGGGRDLQSLRRYEPGQVQRISALPTGQRFLSPLSGISLERASFNAAGRAGSRGEHARAGKALRHRGRWSPRRKESTNTAPTGQIAKMR